MVFNRRWNMPYEWRPKILLGLLVYLIKKASLSPGRDADIVAL